MEREELLEEIESIKRRLEHHEKHLEKYPLCFDHEVHERKIASWKNDLEHLEERLLLSSS